MKKLLSLTAFLFVFISSVFADEPKVYCEIESSYNTFSIKSHVFWNADSDENLKIPSNFITGYDTHYTKKYKLGNKSLKVDLYFPKEPWSDREDDHYTVHVTIHLDNEEILKTKHFGRLIRDEEYAIDYLLRRKIDALCFPNFIAINLDNNNELKIKVQGKYVSRKPGSFNSSIKPFMLNYINPNIINDSLLSTDIIKKANEIDKKQYSKTNNWNIDQFFIDPKQATYSGFKDWMVKQRKKWRNVPIPFVATYEYAELGDYFHLVFKDINGTEHDFGYGKNDLDGFKLYDDEDLYNNTRHKNAGKIFRIYWEWKPSQFLCCEGGTSTLKAYQPSIVKLEVIETNSNNAAYYSEYKTSKSGIINGTNVNMRRSYTSKSPIVSRFKNRGEHVVVLNAYHNPYVIETFINTEITVKTDSGTYLDLQKGKAVKILSKQGPHVRIEFLDNRTKSMQVTTIHESFLDKHANSLWYRVKRKTGETGWVYGKFVYVDNF